MIKSSYIFQHYNLFKQIVPLFLRVIRTNEKQINFKDLKLIICSQILNKESLILRKDHYFGDIFNKIPNKKKLWFYISNSNLEKEIEQYLVQNNIPYVFAENIINIGDIFKIWMNCNKIINYIRSIKRELPDLKLNRGYQNYFNKFLQ